MTEMTIRRMPIDDDHTKRLIVQVPVEGKLDVYQLNDVIPHDTGWAVEWITPVQVSQQYTGVPAPHMTFVVRPASSDEELVMNGGQRTQYVDVFYELSLVQTFAINGRTGRIVAAAPYQQVGDGMKDLTVLSSTMAFLVQFKAPDDEDTENSLTHKFQQS
uniref:Uncharacterized protein n=1 Tax=Pseudomonas phage RVTF4 TaxID=3236931 RepID=A0AB39CDH3_9VIRU